MSHPPSAPRQRFDSLEQEAYLNLWRTYDRLRILEDSLFERYELTAQQYNVLRLLSARHPVKMPTLALAARLISRAPDITRMVDRLCERGLVERERPAENRRVVLIGITAAGLALVQKLAGQVRDCHRQQLGHLEVSELRELVRLLRTARAPHEEPDTSWR